MSDFHYIRQLIHYYAGIFVILISNIVKRMKYARPFYIGRVIHRVHYTYPYLEKILVGNLPQVD